MATILCVWYEINNPDRTPEQDDLNLSVHGVLQLTAPEVRRLAAEAGGLLPVNAVVMDDDTFSDDEVFPNPFPLQLGVHNTDPTQFGFPIIVPHQKLTNTEPGYEDFAEIYCRITARHKVGNQNVFSASKNTDKKNVRIRNP
jgi:hypothetical protein